jgi:hypothetical protein
MRFARGDMRDQIVSCKNDHGASYRRYGVLQWWSRQKIKVCEIFGVVRFSTFATISANSRRAGSSNTSRRGQAGIRLTNKAGHLGPASQHLAYRQISISVAILPRTHVVNPALARFACQAWNAGSAPNLSTAAP